MTSLFDSAVYQARNAIEWAEIDLEYFLKDLAQNQLDGPAIVKLQVHNRPSVRTRFWWTLMWKGCDGGMHHAEAESMQLWLWRAAVREKQIREKVEKQAQKEQERL